MKTLTQLALFFVAISVGLHLYLSLQHYPLKLGFSSGPSICSISPTFDCDTVSVSAFSSFMGIPLSIWGLITNAFLFGMILLAWLQWTDQPERLKRAALLVSGLSVGASLIMGAISITMMKNYCLFCIALYLLSFLTFFFLARTLNEPFFKNFKDDVLAYFSESRGILFALLLIPITSFAAHRVFLSNYGAAELSQFVQRAATGWNSNPVEAIDGTPLLTLGPSREEARFVLTEFADLLCHHCKNAAPSVHAFASAHADVRFEFFLFPLDGACNPEIQNASGLRCFLSKSVYCAEKQSQGWALQKQIFQDQDQLAEMSLEQLQEFVRKTGPRLNFDSEALLACTTTPEAQEAIVLQSKQGKVLNVQGTPTFYGNFKHLNQGQLIPVLEAVRNLSPKKP